jgi:surfeit locus 1 family protein
MPRAADGGAQPPPAVPAGPVEVTGALRWPEPRGTFTPTDDPGRNLWFTRAPDVIAAGKNWGPVAPFYIEQETPQAPDGRPQAGPVRASLPNNHLQYALTWYGLAAALVFVFAAFILRSRDSA